MIELPTVHQRLSDLFYYLAHLYDSKRYPVLNAVYQFSLKEGQETFLFYILISNGKALSLEGKYDFPSVEIVTSVSDFFYMFNGILKLFWILLTGRCRIRGSINHILNIRRIFGKRYDKTVIPELDDKKYDYEDSKKRVWKKPDRVLVLNSSPRGKNGFTYFYLKYFIEGVKQSGADVEVVDIYDAAMKIESCRGCFSCYFATPGRCVINDDCTVLIDKFKNAGLVVFAFPLYINSIPDKLAAFINRCFILVYPYFVSCGNISRKPKRNKKEQYAAVLSIGALPNIEVFKPCIDTFELTGISSHIPVVGSVLVPAAEWLFRNVTSVYNLNRVLKELKSAGRQLAENGKIRKRSLSIISKRYFSDEKILKHLNMHCYLEMQQSNRQ